MRRCTARRRGGDPFHGGGESPRLPSVCLEAQPGISTEELQKWESIDRAAIEHQTSGRWTEAAKQYKAAATIDDRFAELQFRLGQCLARGNRPAGGSRTIRIGLRSRRLAASGRLAHKLAHPRCGCGRESPQCSRRRHGAVIVRKRSGPGRNRRRDVCSLITFTLPSTETIFSRGL